MRARELRGKGSECGVSRDGRKMSNFQGKECVYKAIVLRGSCAMSRLCASKSQTVQYAEVLPTDTVLIPGEGGVLHAMINPMPKLTSSPKEYQSTSEIEENFSDTTSDSPGVTNTGRSDALETDDESAPEEAEISGTIPGGRWCVL